MKLKTIYTCQNCAFQSAKWLGKCPSCESWNSFVEDVIDLKQEKGKPLKTFAAGKTSEIQQDIKRFSRIPTNINELDRVLGGGIVQGSLILLGGEPGIGKSTLTLQLCHHLCQNLKKILYVSGEESTDQISLRASRLNINSQKLKLLNENHLETILATIEGENPSIVIIDSIQVMQSENIVGSAGSVPQVRYCSEALMEYAKKHTIPIILIGHVTKEGQLAGPKVLEHLVDVVVNIEGDRYHDFRILRSAKNRFGSTNEIGVFEMTEKGLLEIANPSKAFLEGRPQGAIGSCITCTLEGSRPLLLEVQALTSITAFGYPRRTASGFDLNRLQLLIAVIQKHLNLALANQDIYINVVGGFQIDDPSCDLAIIMAIISSFQKFPLPHDLLSIGEIGLAGEIRPVSQISRRLEESSRLGLKNIIGPKISEKIPPNIDYRQLFTIKDLNKLLKAHS